MYASDSRQGRPCELHLPSSDSIPDDNTVITVKSPATPNGRLPLGNYQYTAIDKRSLMPNSASKKVMVAPQPHFRSHNADMCENTFRTNGDMQITHRRRVSTTPVAAASGYQIQFDSRHSYPRELSVAVVPVTDSRTYEDRGIRTRSGGDVRVSALEKRVREIEAVITNNNGQLPSSSSSSSTSFIVPVNSKGPQVVVSSISSAATQQLMAQEIADKEVEIERLQSQLRQCYSRMELRKIQFDEEVDKFRKESQDAKSQLEKVKSRLSELEVECSEYRERAAYVEAARNSAISDSLEKISAQEKELSRLRGEMEQLSGLSAELEKVKNELKKSEAKNVKLQSTVETKEKIIHDLEDSLLAVKMEASCKVSSTSLIPHEDAHSLNGIELPRFFAEVEGLKNLTPSLNASKESSTSSHTLRLKKSQSSQQLSPSSVKFTLSPTLSGLIRKQTASTVECRLLAKCLKDTASKAMKGDLPSVSHLLGCRSDSMSESEVEILSTDSSPMTMSSAERHLKKDVDDLRRIEDDLNSLREKFVEYYEKKVVEDLQENDMCKIQ